MICDVEINSAFYGNHQVLEDIRFNLNKGDILAIVGESGTGKTTLARIISGLYRFYGLKFDGKVDIDGKIDVVPQNITDSLDPLFSIESQLREIKDDLDSIKKILAKVGFVDVERILKSYPHNLSGGMKQRVLIAMALLNADIVMADEFTSALDTITKLKIVELLKKLNENENITIIFITHDMELLEFDGDIIVMFGGRIVEKGKILDVKSNPLHPYTRFLINATPRLNMHYSKDRFNQIEIDKDAACPFIKTCSKAKEICRNKKPPLKEVKGRFVRCHF
ncbi:oligopeptide/dipeptide ABC transporter ATP-binding protein [Hippea maritima]|uniref:Oligopeptide/dipeptide ABC transporter, ATPase subunit n=1 Tax=Hippea maritima (strain ATCC 700847 / DSM 10411 / MH2) TaxID=760142 RepID=F2LVE6_HIPMA|nr:ABC transporter ATP-binding protein [Hippea maritima]AEA33730.1 oligopeptide/dipeptide ABC transporter, ATPase subunit [Hippea maritima DSM 10411]